jgi:hypothetical protein
MFYLFGEPLFGDHLTLIFDLGSDGVFLTLVSCLDGQATCLDWNESLAKGKSVPLPSDSRKKIAGMLNSDSFKQISVRNENINVVDLYNKYRHVEFIVNRLACLSELNLKSVNAGISAGLFKWIEDGVYRYPYLPRLKCVSFLRGPCRQHSTGLIGPTSDAPQPSSVL